MRSPFSSTGTLRVDDPTVTVATAVASVEQALRTAKVIQLQAGPSSVAFVGGGRSWSAGWKIGPVSSAQITFTRMPTGIVVHFRWTAFDGGAVAVVAILLLGPIALSGFFDIPVPTYIILLLFSLLVAIIKYFDARKRFPRFLAKTLGVRAKPAPLAPGAPVGEPFPDY